MNEQWKIHPQHPRYEVSNMGNVRHLAHPHVLVRIGHRGPHYQVILGIHCVTLRHLVAEVWVPNEGGHSNVRHKNGNKHDNRADNLEWYSVTYKGGRRKKHNAEGITVTASSDSSWEDRLSQITFSEPTPIVECDANTGEWTVTMKFNRHEDALDYLDTVKNVSYEGSTASMI